METVHCERCGQEYSDTYHKCPFCQEAAAERRGHPIYRRGKRLDQKQRSAGALGVMKLVVLSIALIVVGVVCFGDHVAGFLGIRTENPDTQQGTTIPGTSDNDGQLSDREDLQLGGDTVDVPNNPETEDGEAGADVPAQGDSLPLSLDQTTITIPAGQTARLTATGGSGEIVWTSSNREIASVEGGSVTGVAGGTVTITATSGEETVSCTVTITGDPWVSPVKLSLNYTDFTLRAGDPDVKMKVKGTESTVTWSSSDETIAKVSADGVVTRVSKGTATITAQVDGQTLTCIARMA